MCNSFEFGIKLDILILYILIYVDDILKYNIILNTIQNFAVDISMV